MQLFQVHATGLVVVHEQRILGLHCSGVELHAGQVAVIRHGLRLKGCDLYFSRKPCSTCLKMIINGKQPNVYSAVIFWFKQKVITNYS